MQQPMGRAPWLLVTKQIPKQLAERVGLYEKHLSLGRHWAQGGGGHGRARQREASGAPQADFQGLLVNVVDGAQ